MNYINNRQMLKDFEREYCRVVSENYTLSGIARRFGMKIENYGDIVYLSKVIEDVMLANLLRYEPFLNMPVIAHLYNSERECFVFAVIHNVPDAVWCEAVCIDNSGCRLEEIQPDNYERMIGSEYRLMRDVADHIYECCSYIIPMADML